MELPSAAEFYADRPGPGLFQGDVFLCPASALVPKGLEGLLVRPLPPPPDERDDLGHATVYPLWSPPPAASTVPAAGHLVRWGPVMVLSHECELEKDFNALARLLVKGGMNPDEAQEHAGLRPDADRWVVVAPLLTDAEILEDWPPELRTDARLQDVHRNMRSGYFPVPAGPSGIPAGAVNLNRACTVARGLLTPARFLGSLSDPARGVLRYKLAHLLAYRDLSVQAELERAIGQRITNVVVRELPKEKNKKREVEMVLHLENGDQLQLQGAPIKPAMLEGPTRQGLAAEPST